VLPHVESGTVTMIGATTENPSFEVNGALLSRAAVYVLEPLSDEDLAALLDRARAVALTASHAERAFDEYEVQVAQTLAAQAAAALAMVEARAAASHDALTGCLNQGAMLRRLGEELARARREGGALGVLLIDLDDFKAINDRHGHLVGDGVLRQVGETLRQEFRSNDCVARWGGDEFVVILSGTHGPRAEIAARRALHRIHEINVLSNGRHEAVSASIGMSSSDDPTSADELLANADTALREAKRSGKDRLGFAAAHGPSGAR
jgi:diguanylate cyclase (GGDEF)-like protein